MALTFQHPDEKDNFSRLNKKNLFYGNCMVEFECLELVFKTNRVKIMVRQKPVVCDARDLIRMSI